MFIDPIQIHSLPPIAAIVCPVERPLRENPCLADLNALNYDFESPRWVFQDGEPDDFAAIYLYPQNKVDIIAEHHPIRGEVFRRTKVFLEKLGPARLYPGHAQATDRLIERLKELPDHSLSILLIANSPSLAAILEKEPELLARKVKRIVSYGGFTQRDCEKGRFNGQKVHYTSFNYNCDLQAAQRLFQFAETHRTPLYVIGGDNLRFPSSMRFDLAFKIRSLDTSAARFIAEEITSWNSLHHGSGKGLEKAQDEAEQAGYSREDAIRCEVVPADVIAAVVDLAFDELTIISRGLSKIQITDEPRYDKSNKSRAVLFQEDPNSSIRYVDGFYLKDSELSSPSTFQLLANDLFNLRSSEQTFQPPKRADFYSLQGELLEMLADHDCNYEKRLKLFEQFSALQAELNQNPPTENRELFAFATQGRGAESVRIFSKEPIDLRYDDPDYGGKIMELATNPSRLLPERLALHEQLREKTKHELVEIKDHLAYLFPEQGRVVLFTRGMIGSGKSSLLSAFGLREAFSSDDTKLYLGGTLSHHEAVAFSNGLDHCLQVKTNIRERDNKVLCNPPPNTKHIIWDIAIDADTVEARLAQRPGRKPAPAEIEEGLRLSAQNRIPLVEAALENSQIEWHLYDNNGEKPRLIASIVDQQLEVFDDAAFSYLAN